MLVLFFDLNYSMQYGNFGIEVFNRHAKCFYNQWNNKKPKQTLSIMKITDHEYVAEQDASNRKHKSN